LLRCGKPEHIADVSMKKLQRLNEVAATVRRENSHAPNTAWILFILFVAVAGIDVISTTAAIAAGHVEANPVIRGLQAFLGAWWPAPKMGFHLALGLLILWLPTRKMISLARLVVVGYIAIITNNFYFAGWLI
jgi:hypothetical protein